MPSPGKVGLVNSILSLHICCLLFDLMAGKFLHLAVRFEFIDEGASEMIIKRFTAITTHLREK